MNDRPRVLVVDDEPQILRALRIILREAGFEVLQAATAEEALDLAALKPPAAAIVDLVLPDRDGVEVTRALRAWSLMPILVLTAVGEEDEKVRALAAGADDYVTKPFGPRELVARLQAALRRADPGVSEPVIGPTACELDLAAHTVPVDGAGVHLTPIEFNLLRALATNRGRLMTHRALLVDVWGPEYADDVQVLRVHMSNLRRKIGARFSTPTPAWATASRSRRRSGLRCAGRADLGRRASVPRSSGVWLLHPPLHRAGTPRSPQVDLPREREPFIPAAKRFGSNRCSSNPRTAACAGRSVRMAGGRRHLPRLDGIVGAGRSSSVGCTAAVAIVLRLSQLLRR